MFCKKTQELKNLIFFYDSGIRSLDRIHPTSANDRPPELSRRARRGIQKGRWSPHINPTNGHTLVGFSVLGPKVPQNNHLPTALESIISQVEFNHWTTNTWLKKRKKKVLTINFLIDYTIINSINLYKLLNHK